MNKLELCACLHPPVRHDLTARCRAQNAFVCNLESHWFAIRKLHGRWFNLNSILDKPEEISDFYLSAFLAQLQSDGYSIFTVQGSLPEPMKDTSLSDDMTSWHALADCLTSAQPKPAKAHKVSRATLNDELPTVTLVVVKFRIVFVH